MARRLNRNPSYLLHRQSGKARMVVRDHDGNRKEIFLPGPYDSKESTDEYARQCALLRANGGRLPRPENAAADMTVAEVVAKYMDFAKDHYLDPDGTPTGEVTSLRLAFRPLVRLHGTTLAREFDSLALKALQRALATGSWLNAEERAKKEKERRPIGLCRVSVNGCIDRIKRWARWACSEKLLPADVLVNLESVASLRRHRSPARETAPVTPVAQEVIDKTLPHIPPVVVDVVRLLLLCGARVGELLQLTESDLDMTGDVWTFTPARHKTAAAGHKRIICFGPKAQLILRRYLGRGPGVPLFSPADADAQRKAAMRMARKTKVQPSQLDRSKPSAERKPGAVYTSRAVNHAVRRACLKAGVPIWHTHQCRHNAALTIMRELGIEAARSALGHRTLNLSLYYAGVDTEKAKSVAQRLG